MHEFAFLFRTDHVPPAADLARRNAAARDWALARRADGSLRSASPLEDAGAVVGARGVTAVSADHPVASVLVIAAENLEAAVTLAKGHPGLAFGTTIEVRPVKAVAPPPPVTP